MAPGRKSQVGQSLVEFALTLPALLMLIGLTINVLLWGLALTLATSAANDAARASVVHTQTGWITSDMASWNILRDRVNIALNPGLGQGWDVLVEDDSIWRDHAWAWVEKPSPLVQTEGDENVVRTKLHLGVFFISSSPFSVPITGRAASADYGFK